VDVDSFLRAGRITAVESIEQLSFHNLQFNTVLDISDLRPDRLTKVKFVRRIENGLLRPEKCTVTGSNWTAMTFPLNHFLEGMGNSPYEPMSSAMSEAWELLLILQERARHHRVTHWSKLPKTCLPMTWFDRTKQKPRINDTFDGGCGQCSWLLGRPPPLDTPEKSIRVCRGKRPVESDDSSAPCMPLREQERKSKEVNREVPTGHNLSNSLAEANIDPSLTDVHYSPIPIWQFSTTDRHTPFAGSPEMQYPPHNQASESYAERTASLPAPEPGLVRSPPLYGFVELEEVDDTT